MSPGEKPIVSYLSAALRGIFRRKQREENTKDDMNGGPEGQKTGEDTGADAGSGSGSAPEDGKTQEPR